MIELIYRKKLHPSDSVWCIIMISWTQSSAITCNFLLEYIVDMFTIELYCWYHLPNPNPDSLDTCYMLVKIQEDRIPKRAENFYSFISKNVKCHMLCRMTIDWNIDWLVTYFLWRYSVISSGEWKLSTFWFLYQFKIQYLYILLKVTKKVFKVPT